MPLRGLAVQTGVWLRAVETEINAALLVLSVGRILRFLLCTQGELDSEYDQIKSSGEASSLDSREALLMYRRIEGTEKSLTGLAGRVESLVSQLERIERAKSKRRETMSKLLENITEVFTRYRAVGVGKRACSASLYHSRQCGIVVKPRLDCLDIPSFAL